MLARNKAADAMSRPTGGVETAIEPGMVARVIAGVRYAVTGQKPDWFGPGTPQEPSAPDSIKGRAFQVPVGSNITTSRKQEGVSFDQLRAFADACEIVRMLIETRKDQMCSKSWRIKKIGKDTQGHAAMTKKFESPGPGVVEDPRITALTKFFRKPDKEHTWAKWLRMLLEDMFVVDAATLYVQNTKGGEMYALRPIAGDTIKRVIDTHGWTPQAPDAAYQQILQGMAASNFSVDELIYSPRNPRAHKVYGYSHVEQVIITAKLWLSRQASNLEYYQSGNLPEGFLTGAKEWSPDQLMAFQDNIDAMLSGNFAERSKVRAIPNGSAYTAAKEPALKSDFDEWLVRIACFCFSYPPTPFIRQMNRTTSETAKTAADEEGDAPISLWVVEMMNDIIQDRLGFDDLEFVFQDRESQNPLERAQIDQIYLETQVLVPNEVRADLGRDPIEGGDNIVPLAPDDLGTSPEGGGSGGGGPPKASGRAPRPGARPGDKKVITKAIGDDLSASDPAPVDLDSALSITTRNRLAEAIAAALQLIGEQSVTQVTKEVESGLMSPDAIVDHLVLSGLGEVLPELQEGLSTVAIGAENAALESLGLSVRVNLSNDFATSWAADRAASLIKTDGAGGALLDTTKELIRGTITEAVAGGWSNKQLAKALSDNYAFSPDRAMMIARTEIAAAEVTGNLHAWITSGVVKNKQWLLGEGACVICEANAAQGVIPLLEPFLSGELGPPAHPNCRCALSGKIN